MLFVNDQSTALKAYQAGQYNFVWNITPQDLPSAKGMSGFVSESLLQTDLLFFNNKMAPFNNAAVRQAFAHATDKAALATAIFKGSAIPAPTIIPLACLVINQIIRDWHTIKVKRLRLYNPPIRMSVKFHRSHSRSPIHRYLHLRRLLYNRCGKQR